MLLHELKFIFLTATENTDIYTLSLHDALPICRRVARDRSMFRQAAGRRRNGQRGGERQRDRKSTRMNSSHLGISYAVFCLKKKKGETSAIETTDDDEKQSTAVVQLTNLNGNAV